jgi:tRNA(Ile)-lysidine synthase
MPGRSARPDAAPDLNSPPVRFDPPWLRAQLHRLLGSLTGRQLCVAFSGGMDSCALLSALSAARARGRFQLRALHVNHQLQPQAGDFAQAALATARLLRVPCRVLVIDVAHAAGESLEAAARTARYRALRKALRPSELLLTAHHQEDQLETMLLALMRGSGVRGLSAMSPVTTLSHTLGDALGGTLQDTLLVRPLLPVSRSQLQVFIAGQGVAWSDDPSNQDARFDRNYLRLAVIPRLRERWPAAAASAGRSARHLAEAQALLEQLSASSLRDARDGRSLCISALRRLPDSERRNALRSWIAQQGLPLPDLRRLREIAGPLLSARHDATPSVHWPGAGVRRHGDRLFAEMSAEAAVPAVGATPAAPAKLLCWEWQTQPWLPLPSGLLGIVPDRHGDLDLSMLPPQLSVGFRRGGERLRGTQGHTALKDLLQQRGTVPWRRECVPLVMHEDAILAVADLWIDPRYRASGRGTSARGRLRWRHD